MLTARVGLEAIAGRTLRLGFSVTDQDGQTADITGTTATLALRKLRASEADVSVAGSITEAEAGQFEAVLTPTQTQALAGVYEFEATLEDLDGSIASVARGSIHFMGGVVAA